MCLKLFILKEFYFLILESNVETHHKNISKGGSLGPVSLDTGPNQDPYPSELLSTKIKESRINES